jgi:WD40 repeat protein
MAKIARGLAALAPFLLTAAANTGPPQAKEGHAGRGPLQPLLTCRGHAGACFYVQYSRDGKRLATASRDMTSALWDAATGKRLLTLRGHTRPVMCVASSLAGGRLATAAAPSRSGLGDSKGSVRVWDTVTGRATLLLDPGEGWVDDLAVSPKGDYVAAGGEPRGGESNVQVWDARSGKRIPGYHDPKGSVRGVAFSPDGKRLATGGSGPVTVWETAVGGKALTLGGHQGTVRALAWSPDGRRLAAILDGTVRVWGLASPEQALTVPWEGGTIRGVAFAPEGHLLFAAEDQHGVRVGVVRWLGTGSGWDTGIGKLALRWGEQQQAGVYRLAFSPCGTRLATAHGDGTVRIWSVEQLVGNRVSR